MKRLSALWINNKVFSECRIHGKSDPFIEKVTFSSHECTQNSVFIAFRGLHLDGHTFIAEAIGNGATVIVHENAIDHYDDQIVYIQHPHPRRIASLFCKALAGPLPKQIIGVTGTDGKSSTCEFLYHLLQQQHIRCGVLSTVFMDDGSGKIESPYRQSTPEVPFLYQFLSRCKAHGVDLVVLETTSHGLSDQGARLADIQFYGAIYTQITSEHLEFHGNVEAYVDAKMNLARQVRPQGIIVSPYDFSYRDELKKIADQSKKLCTYSVDQHAKEVQLHYKTVAETLENRIVSFSYQHKAWTCTGPFGQECYTQNAMGAILFALSSNLISWEQITHQSIHFPTIPGRFELVNTPLPFTIIIDFAHTAKAFELLFSHIRIHRPNCRIIALFGAAGERDRSKRIPMGLAAARYCDALFLTDEDPRGEHAQSILDDLEAGARTENPQIPIFRIHDRKQAITEAMAYCMADDVLLLLAKGHEKTIAFKEYSITWNEKAVIERLAMAMGENGES